MPLFARQSIFTAEHELYGFEFLYRGARLGSDDPNAAHLASIELLDHMCTCILEENLNAGKPLLLNVDEQFLLDDNLFHTPLDNVIFEILETVEPTPEIVNRVRKLAQAGFKFALDDFVFEPNKTPFFKYLSILKIDVMGIDWALMASKLPELQLSNCLLLAEKIESEEEFERCKALGFDLFQGYHLERPKPIHGKKLETNQQAALRLVSELSRPDIETEEVAQLISLDPILTVKILRLINCPLYQLVREVKSVREAVVILGLNVVKQWAIILSLVSASDSPQELFRQLLVRAKTLALIGERQAKEQPDIDVSGCFLTGILSGVDAIFGTEQGTVIQQLTLDDEVKRALLTQDNFMGQLLNDTIGYERFDSSVFERMSDEQKFAFIHSYQKSLVWADEVLRNLPS
ncbi:HDOD domain-containing protein [Alteromonas sp. ASW11-36]|uniref:HDOD domain-containing protein n=1 Tax=Alteromonas arenosi TaxID=3055817 RepID=A0ABT7SY68_9ALTE|nr:HDOD domain-containing protein [Alteromonas sp. ASW11-36]MDM7861131.1 HDOD domain-containing protein [Alteromonas sp. ASW11-36]